MEETETRVWEEIKGVLNFECLWYTKKLRVMDQI